jgi:hypothetical protein
MVGAKQSQALHRSEFQSSPFKIAIGALLKFEKPFLTAFRGGKKLLLIHAINSNAGIKKQSRPRWRR